MCFPCCLLLLLLLLAAGWFSLNVPSGLTLYWFVNNIISTAMQIYMKKTIKVDMPPLAAAGEANAIIDVTGEVIKPKEDREKKVGVNIVYFFLFLFHLH
jgi:YidC/Oxa1 family membrane protein insertase